MHRRGFAPLILLFIVSIIGLTIFAYLKKANINKVTSLPPLASISPTPIPSTFPTKKPVIYTPLPTKTPTKNPTPLASYIPLSSSTPTINPSFNPSQIPLPNFEKNGTVTITSPNGGETFHSGDTMHITWTTSGPLTNFNLFLSSGPNTRIPIKEVYYGAGSYDWTVNIGSGTDTQFKIYAYGINLNGVLADDYSNNNFTVPRP